MKVICKYNKGSDLTDRYYEAGYTPETQFNLEVGREYVVYGVSLWNDGSLHYLVLGEGVHSPFYKPDWEPAVLFDLKQNKIPEYWHYTFLGEGCPINAIWGYDELVNFAGHYDGLIEREVEHLHIFQERKKLIDAEYLENAQDC